MKKRLMTWTELNQKFPGICYRADIMKYTHNEWSLEMVEYIKCVMLGAHMHVENTLNSSILEDPFGTKYDIKWFVEENSDTTTTSSGVKTDTCKHEWKETPGFLAKSVYKDCVKCGMKFEDYKKKKKEYPKQYAAASYTESLEKYMQNFLDKLVKQNLC